MEFFIYGIDYQFNLIPPSEITFKQEEVHLERSTKSLVTLHNNRKFILFEELSGNLYLIIGPRSTGTSNRATQTSKIVDFSREASLLRENSKLLGGGRVKLKGGPATGRPVIFFYSESQEFGKFDREKINDHSTVIKQLFGADVICE